MLDARPMNCKWSWKPARGRDDRTTIAAHELRPTNRIPGVASLIASANAKARHSLQMPRLSSLKHGFSATLSGFGRATGALLLVASIALGSTAFGDTESAFGPKAPIRVAVVGLVHQHVDGLFPQLSQHPEIQLVGIEEPNIALAERYRGRFHLNPNLFYTQIDTMIERTHPQALLVYTDIADHRRVIEIAAAHGVSAMVERPLSTSLADALAIRRIANAYSSWLANRVGVRAGGSCSQFVLQ